MAIVFVVDVTSDGYPTGMQYVPRTPNTIPVAVNSDSWTPLDIAAQAMSQLPLNGRIEELHFCSHGNSGRLFMGGGINRSNVSQMSFMSPRLNRTPMPNATVRIHGCAVASATDIDDGCMDRSNPARPVRRDFCMPTTGRAVAAGPTPAPGSRPSISNEEIARRIRACAGYQFVAAMAATLRVNVQGAVHAQDVDWVGRHNWQLQGATLTVQPDGRGILVDPHGNIGIAGVAATYNF